MILLTALMKPLRESHSRITRNWESTRREPLWARDVDLGTLYKAKGEEKGKERNDATRDRPIDSLTILQTPKTLIDGRTSCQFCLLDSPQRWMQLNQARQLWKPFTMSWMPGLKDAVWIIVGNVVCSLAGNCELKSPWRRLSGAENQVWRVWLAVRVCGLCKSSPRQKEKKAACLPWNIAGFAAD